MICCAICGNKTDKYTEIEIDDFEYKIICSSCMTKNLEKLIDDAVYKNCAFITAASESLRANEKLENEIIKKQKAFKKAQRKQKMHTLHNIGKVQRRSL